MKCKQPDPGYFYFTHPLPQPAVQTQQEQLERRVGCLRKPYGCVMTSTCTPERQYTSVVARATPTLQKPTTHMPCVAYLAAALLSIHNP